MLNYYQLTQLEASLETIIYQDKVNVRIKASTMDKIQKNWFKNNFV